MSKSDSEITRGILCRIPSRLGFLVLALAPLPAGPAAASITGVCPDGSMYIVKRAENIPCPDSKRVDPNDMPPIRPAYLPRPYGWERFQREQDPNNPYNLIEDERRDEAPEAPAVGTAPPPPEPQTARRNPPAPSLPAVEAAGPRVDLTADELRDLSLIVEISQRHAPATLERRGESGDPTLVLRLAHSSAFEARLREGFGGRAGLSSGPVLLFSARAHDPEPFHANLTFVQGHLAFHPTHDDPLQFGVLRGSLGDLAAGDEVLGYVVLPERVDLGLPLDVYWNDRQLTARIGR